MGLTDYTISDKKYWQAGREYEREQILAELTKLTDRFNTGEADSNMVMYLYRFIEEKRNNSDS